jgi:quercetin dioxygenase-like cupin family protein
MHCLKGQATFVSGDERAELKPTSVIRLASEMPHRVVAQPDRFLLVTISERIRSPSGPERASRIVVPVQIQTSERLYDSLR